MQAQAGVVNNRKLLLSRMEAEDLQERDLLCPLCGFRIQTLYSDASGHLRVKCPKCKGIHILNLAYFRRIKRIGSYARLLTGEYKK
jgi:phage FluMu protein Com